MKNFETRKEKMAKLGQELIEINENNVKVEVININGDYIFNRQQMGDMLDVARDHVSSYFGDLEKTHWDEIVHLRERRDSITSLGRKREMILYHEQAFYKFCMWSGMPRAVYFRDQVAKLLNNLRKHGKHNIQAEVTFLKPKKEEEKLLSDNKKTGIGQVKEVLIDHFCGDSCIFCNLRDNLDVHRKDGIEHPSIRSLGLLELIDEVKGSNYIRMCKKCHMKLHSLVNSAK